MNRSLLAVATLLTAVAANVTAAATSHAGAAPRPSSHLSAYNSVPVTSHVSPSDGFVVRDGDDLKLDGRRFRFGGTNNYYLMYKSRLMVDDVFADASAAGFTVLRTWGFLDIGNQDGSGSVHGKADGVYFQYWDGERPAYNDGADGLQRLDYVLAAAGRAGVKLVIPLTNNWNDFGGIAQYVRWRGAQFHSDFYTDPVIRGWYRDWVSHVLHRVNSITGVRYADDPAVMTWELGNEPRCGGSGLYPRSPSCTTATITSWADEMTRHIKSIDRRHLVSVGDEGFFCDDPAGSDWTTNCGEGIDALTLTRLPAVDVMSFHLYPEPWGKDAAWGTEWITRHVREARRVGKPVMLGEFGLPDKAVRNPVYQQWTDAFSSAGGTGFLYWILSGIQDDGTLYPDYDGLTVYCPSPVCTTLSNAGAELALGQRSRPPVADHDTAVTEFGVPVVLSPAANDIAYRTRVRPESVDLDPALAGQQRVRTVPAGVFELGAGGSVTFTPAAEFTGRAVAPYTVRDLAGRTSNVAELTVTVRPDPGAPIQIASFETGTEGWAPGSWHANPGDVAQTTEFHTHGSHGLHVNSIEGAWFGITPLPEPLDLSTKATFAFDLRTGAAGTSTNIALQVGPGFAWCEATWNWVPQEQTVTVEIDLLTQVSCDPAGFDDIRGILLWVSPGQFDLDNVRAL
jgi:mannan endo-1,4-beta-mannosidase